MSRAPLAGRRRFIRIAPLAGAAAWLGIGDAARAAAPLVDEKEAAAVTIGYVSDAARADKARYKTWGPGQACGNCALFQGKAGDASGPCPLFAGKAVAAKAWCSAYAKKAA